MSRYFYTDPLAAAWMAKHFGMRFQAMAYGNGGPEMRDVHDDKIYGVVAGGSDMHHLFTFYVHPHSLHLLVPLVGDIVKNCDDDPARVVSDRHGGRVFTTTLSVAEQYVGTEAEIIQRDGKSFHWPESEAA